MIGEKWRGKSEGERHIIDINDTEIRIQACALPVDLEHAALTPHDAPSE